MQTKENLQGQNCSALRQWEDDDWFLFVTFDMKGCPWRGQAAQHWPCKHEGDKKGFWVCDPLPLVPPLSLLNRMVWKQNEGTEKN
jgi:hypothetical protein